MVLYESHSVIHGRPFPLKGRYYANVFIHFEPVGHSLRHNAGSVNIDLYEKYKADSMQGKGGHEHETGLPPYIRDSTPEATRWKASHPNGWSVVSVLVGLQADYVLITRDILNILFVLFPSRLWHSSLMIQRSRLDLQKLTMLLKWATLIG